MRAYRHTASALLLALVLAACSSGATPLWQAAAPTAVSVAMGGAATNVPLMATVRPRSTPADARFSTAEWRTDFGMSSLPLGEITPGGSGRDGIPPIDAPRFVTVTAANAWLKPREPVIVVARGALARAYPLQILIWHEIVDDDFGGRHSPSPSARCATRRSPSTAASPGASSTSAPPATCATPTSSCGIGRPSPGGSRSPARRSWAN